ncbi:hypothetical protein EVAR_57846_1 [Eumeta japonica]|uniref:Uncharacterized protein n=1 Tax=Eumeta variegata TaxID=151549 RepID=A0A4C1YS55_EUMVA|nr:hypothetical protein EVAR_57846_1 [Eumeta japonica]
MERLEAKVPNSRNKRQLCSVTDRHRETMKLDTSYRLSILRHPTSAGVDISSQNITIINDRHFRSTYKNNDNDDFFHRPIVCAHFFASRSPGRRCAAGYGLNNNRPHLNINIVFAGAGKELNKVRDQWNIERAGIKKPPLTHKEEIRMSSSPRSETITRSVGRPRAAAAPRRSRDPAHYGRLGLRASISRARRARDGRRRKKRKAKN